jgi:hypothetical protein
MILDGNLTNTTNPSFTKYNSPLKDGETSFGLINVVVGKSLQYQPVYLDGRQTIEATRKILLTSVVLGVHHEGNTLTVKTQNSTYTFNTKTKSKY